MLLVRHVARWHWETVQIIHIDRSKDLPRVAEMRRREKLTFVHDASGSIGVVMEFSESHFEAYSMPDLALIGGFQTKAQAAQVSSRSRQLVH
jgi:hypothetical protein